MHEVSTLCLSPTVRECVAALTCWLARDADNMLYRLGDRHDGESLCREGAIGRVGSAERGPFTRELPECEVRSAGKLRRVSLAGANAKCNCASHRRHTQSRSAPHPLNTTP